MPVIDYKNQTITISDYALNMYEQANRMPIEYQLKKMSDPYFNMRTMLLKHLTEIEEQRREDEARRECDAADDDYQFYMEQQWENMWENGATDDEYDSPTIDPIDDPIDAPIDPDERTEQSREWRLSIEEQLKQLAALTAKRMPEDKDDF